MKRTKLIKTLLGLTFGIFLSCLITSPSFVKAAPTYNCDGGSLDCVTVEVLGGDLNFYKSIVIYT